MEMTSGSVCTDQGKENTTHKGKHNGKDKGTSTSKGKATNNGKRNDKADQRRDQGGGSSGRTFYIGSLPEDPTGYPMEPPGGFLSGDKVQLPGGFWALF